MTSHYRHRRIYNPAAGMPTPIEPGEIAVNTANRQLGVGDADPASSGSVKPLIAVRFFDVKAQYAIGDHVWYLGAIYRAHAAVTPGPFDTSQWDVYVTYGDGKTYIDAADAAITTAFQDADAAITTDYQAADAALTSAVNGKVNKAGDTMAGPLQLAGPPENDNEAATKAYVDETVATGGTTPRADQIITVPQGGLSSGNVQLQLYELDLEKAPLASPQFTGDPRAPTPPVNDNDISIATTAFVAGQASTINPQAPGTAAPGASLKYAREDHVHPADATRAPIDSPAFTGTPTAPTPPPGDNDTSIATTAFVQNAVVGVSGFSTGDVKLTFKSTADGGWVMMNDGTIGDASSGGTTRAGADCHALFILFWDSIPDIYCPVVGGRGSSSASDWSAHKAITLPRALGRALAIAGSGAGLSGRALGQFLGEEGHTLIADEQASMPVGAMTVSSSGPITAKLQTLNNDSGSPFPGNRMMKQDMGGDAISPTYTDVAVTGTANVTGSTGAGTATGGGQPHNNMPPMSFLNVMVKL
jgi:microcystin-dependent protein